MAIRATTINQTLTYDDASVVHGNASNRVKTISFDKAKGLNYTYTYDEMGNIEVIVVKENDVQIEKYEYHYDGLNQLVREDVDLKGIDDDTKDFTTVYEFDNHGNISSKMKYTYQPLTDTDFLIGTPEISSYGYTNEWKDLLTKYNNQDIAYDDMGNPLEIKQDDANKIVLTWLGRQLTSYKEYVDYEVVQSITYRYNNQGIRTYKKVETDSNNYTEYNYHLNGDQVIYERITKVVAGEASNSHIYYTYDVDGTIIGFNYKNNEYFYIRNIQGDIVKILDINGDEVVSYTYDAWGNILDQTNNDLAKMNPYQYREYRYDDETGLYYLNSRYYNSDWGRFINADGLIGQTGDLLGHNMFAYTQNNPVMYVDPDGTNPFLLALGAVLAPEIVIPALIIVTVAVVLLSPPGQEALRDGLQAGADAIGSAVDGISQAASNLKNSIKEKINTTSVAISTALVLTEKANNGTYAVQFSDGNYYVGKGGPLRMYASALREGWLQQSTPVSFRFDWSSSAREAFKKEYMWMVDYGYADIETRGNLYNRIWSPGRKYYLEDFGRLYGEDQF